MKKLIVFVLSLVSVQLVNAQIQDPVKWSFSAEKVGGSTYEVRLTATLEEGWHVYSQTTPDGGPIPTSIEFTKNPLVTLDGTTKEVGKLHQKHEPLFGVDVKQFDNKVVFVQKVKVKGNAKTTVTGTIEFMTCNDRECLPPKTQKFSIALK
jgi:thiol:disulfide interchange protein DsbD